MDNAIAALLYGLMSVGLVVAFVALSCGIKHLCRQYLKRSKKNDDK